MFQLISSNKSTFFNALSLLWSSFFEDHRSFCEHQLVVQYSDPSGTPFSLETIGYLMNGWTVSEAERAVVVP